METDDELEWYLEPPEWQLSGAKEAPPPADWPGDIFPRWEAFRRAHQSADAVFDPAIDESWRLSDIYALRRSRDGEGDWRLTCKGVPPEAYMGNKALRLVVAPDPALEIQGCGCGSNAIGARAFKGCVNLNYVTHLANDVYDIEEEAFAGCSALREIWNFPFYLTRIGKRAFQGCERLWRICLPDCLDEIGEEAFSGCSALLKVTFAECMPDCLRFIGPRAFAGCASLRKVYLPQTLETLGTDAFAGCRALRHVILPRTLEASIPDAFPDSTEADFVFH